MPIDECIRKCVAEQPARYRVKALQLYFGTDGVRWLAAEPHTSNGPFLTMWIW